MKSHRYLMRDFNRNKVDSIMQFNVATQGKKRVSMHELALFLAALAAYLCILALGT